MVECQSRSDYGFDNNDVDRIFCRFPIAYYLSLLSNWYCEFKKNIESKLFQTIIGLQFGGRLTCAERLQKSISAIGYPLIQGGSSTVLCLTSLLFAGTYMSEVFVKTMLLVVFARPHTRSHYCAR